MKWTCSGIVILIDSPRSDKHALPRLSTRMFYVEYKLVALFPGEADATNEGEETKKPRRIADCFYEKDES
jgi:hypothetical protein